MVHLDHLHLVWLLIWLGLSLITLIFSFYVFCLFFVLFPFFYSFRLFRFLKLFRAVKNIQNEKQEKHPPNGLPHGNFHLYRFDLYLFMSSISLLKFFNIPNTIKISHLMSFPVNSKICIYSMSVSIDWLFSFWAVLFLHLDLAYNLWLDARHCEFFLAGGG